MKLYYLWNVNISGKLNTNIERDPKVFFDKMLYKAHDRWSFITDDYAVGNILLFWYKQRGLSSNPFISNTHFGKNKSKMEKQAYIMHFNNMWIM